MNRQELLNALTLVAPAIADNDMIPILTHFWFRGDVVMAFNDQIAISVPCKTEFKGAVPANTLLGFLRASINKPDVELIPEGKQLLIKIKNAKLRLGVLDPTDFSIFDMPPMPNKDKKTGLVATPNFIDGITSCMRSVSLDTSVLDQLGVTLIPTDDRLMMFSTDGATLSHVKTPMKSDGAFKRVVLSNQFCKQLISLYPTAAKHAMDVRKDHVIFTTSKGAVLFGRLIDVDKPLDFDRVLMHHCPKGFRNKMMPMPTNKLDHIKMMLERAMLITESSSDQSTMSIVVKDGKMRFAAESARGKFNDVMTTGDSHPDVSVQMKPKLLKAGVDAEFDKLLITEKCAIMTKESQLYMVSASGV